MSKLASPAFAACWVMFGLMFAPAFAADPPQPQAGTPPPAGATAERDAPAGSLDEVVCKVREEPITGTRIVRKRKICRTRREWLEETRIAQDALNDVQESGRTQSGIDFGRKGGGGN